MLILACICSNFEKSGFSFKVRSKMNSFAFLKSVYEVETDFIRLYLIHFDPQNTCHTIGGKILKSLHTTHEPPSVQMVISAWICSNFARLTKIIVWNLVLKAIKMQISFVYHMFQKNGACFVLKNTSDAHLRGILTCAPLILKEVNFPWKWGQKGTSSRSSKVYTRSKLTSLAYIQYMSTPRTCALNFF